MKYDSITLLDTKNIEKNGTIFFIVAINFNQTSIA